METRVSCLQLPAKQVALFGTKQPKTATAKATAFFGCPTAVIRWSSELRLWVWVKPTVKKGDQQLVVLFSLVKRILIHF